MTTRNVTLVEDSMRNKQRLNCEGGGGETPQCV